MRSLDHVKIYKSSDYQSRSIAPQNVNDLHSKLDRWSPIESDRLAIAANTISLSLILEHKTPILKTITRNQCNDFAIRQQSDQL